MAVRQFDNVDDKLTTSLGSCDTSGGALTWAALVKRTNTAIWNPIWCHETSGNAKAIKWMWRDTNALYVEPTTGGSESTTTFTSTTTWYIFVLTMASGSGIPRGHWYSFASSQWTHEVFARSTIRESSHAGGHINFGANVGDAAGPMKIAAAAEWIGLNMSDAQAAQLSTNLKTSDWYNHAAGTPSALWEFNQASTSTSVTDLTGNGANQSALTGTTVVTGDDPSGWTFDGTGATPQIIRPDADTDATGWSTAPLYSKVNDQSDATVITATLA